MKAHLIETEDYVALFLDGRYVGINNQWPAREILGLALGVDNVQSDWAEPDSLQATVEEVKKHYKLLLEPSYDLREAGFAYLKAQQEYKRLYRKLDRVDEDVSHLYNIFYNKAEQQGLRVPEESKQLLDNLQKELGEIDE